MPGVYRSKDSFGNLSNYHAIGGHMLNSNKGVRGSRGGKSLNSCVVRALVLLSLPSLPTHLLPPLPFSHSLSLGFLGSRFCFFFFFTPSPKGKHHSVKVNRNGVTWEMFETFG